MRQDRQAANYCKLCGRELKGTEGLTGICIRCKSIGNREGAQDVQDAFEKALSRYFVERTRAASAGAGWVALTLALVVAVMFLVVLLISADPWFALRFALVAGAPVEIVALVIAAVSLMRRKANPGPAVVALALNALALAWVVIKARAAWAALSAGSVSPLGKLVDVFLRLIG